MGIFGNKKDKLQDFRLNLSAAYTPKARPDFMEDAFTFKNANVVMTLLASQIWFEDETIQPKQVESLQNFLSTLPEWTHDAKLSRAFMYTEDQFNECTRISWSESKVGTLFLNSLSKLGAQVQKIPSPQDANKEIISGTWGISDGRPLPILGEAWKNNTTGEEFIYWFFDAMVHTRPTSSRIEVSPSRVFFLPLLFQSCAYLSETLFPSVPISMKNRSQVFEVSSNSEIPKLAFHSEKNYYHLGLSQQGNRFGVHYFWTPETTRYGYIFKESDLLKDGATSLAIASDALPKVADILVDGFCNYGPNSEIPFQDVCVPDHLFIKESEISHFEFGLFVPGPIHIELEVKTIELYGRSQEAAHLGLQRKNSALLLAGLNGYQEVISKGVGTAVAHSVNSYVYTQNAYGNSMLALDEDAKAGFSNYAVSLLEFGSQLPVDLQDANACSNLALIEVGRNNFEAALKAVNRGIAILKEDRRNLPHSAMGNSVVELNPGIKLELFSTKSEILYRHGQVEKAKEIAQNILEEASHSGHSGPEVEKAKWIVNN